MIGRLAVPLFLAYSTFAAAGDGGPSVRIEPLTTGPKHHFFGYIGHAGTIPWNRSGRYIVALQTRYQDRMPRPEEAAEIVLIDTQRNNEVRVVDRTLAWNFQQGTMLFWNPEAAETQFFFNDREPGSNRVFCVLFDIEANRRIGEFRNAGPAVGNSGVARKGGAFLALNYGRLHRLREVTGYPGAFDPTAGVKHPANDGIFRVDVRTGRVALIVLPYRQIADALRSGHPAVDGQELFINHTLWNRDDDRILFYARADFEDRARRLDVLFTVAPDGRELVRLPDHLGGHVNWADSHQVLGSRDGRIALYDTDRRAFLATPAAIAALPGADGDKAFSPAHDWLVNGYRDGEDNRYALLRLADSARLTTRGFNQHGWLKGPLRIDPAPCWNRDATQVLFCRVAPDAERTRQLFVIHIDPGASPR